MPVLTAQAGPANVTLGWTVGPNPRGVRLLRRPDRHPESPNDPTATVVYDGTGTTTTDRCLAPGATYHYAIWSYNGCTTPVFSTEFDSARASPFMAGLPPPPSDLIVGRGPHELRLSWQVTAEDCSTKVAIRRSESSFPAGPSDGDSVYQGGLPGVVDTGLSPLKTYYYSAFSLDRYGRYSTSAAHGYAIPDWENIDIEIPPFEMYDRFPGQNCRPFADCDFSGHRPRVEMDVQIRNDGNLTFWAEVTRFVVRETVEDYTCVQKYGEGSDVWGTPTFTGPTGQGWILVGYVGTTGFETIAYYADFGIDRKYGTVVVDYVDIAADTPGDDVCGTTEDDTHLHKLVTRPLTARLRR